LQQRLALAVVLLPTVGIVAAGVLARQNGVATSTLVVAGVMTAITLLGIEAGFHRLFSHHAFAGTTAVRVGFAIAGSMAAQGPVVFWAAIHRRHHAFSDREGDPHSPHLHGPGLKGLLKGLWHAHMGWLFVPETTIEWSRYTPDLLKDRPIFDVNRRYPLWVLLGLAVPALLGGLLSGTAYGALEGLLWGGLSRIFVVNHCTWSVNSLCHLLGSRPHASRDRSTNNGLLSLLSVGGSWHNNHHAFPAAARNNFRWWQIDLSGEFIGLLALLGLAWDLKTGMAAQPRPSDPAMPSPAVDPGKGG
jgi:stearoyl-CoA desaturase (delta-9 desaturase)